ncbi:MAG: glycosyltransferase family 4 protein [Myxococcota bacterium]|nr:glycosyltransferase family 4 protein [Myxococcota bacterium]
MSEPMLTLFLPRESHTLSGGNLYNRELLAALRRQVEVATPPIDELWNVLARGTAGTYLIDTLDLGAAPAIERRAPGQRFGLLVHHLPSLEPGLRLSDPARELERQVLGRFDFWVTTSTFARHLLLARDLPSDRVFSVPPGLGAVERGARELGSSLSALSAGNLIPRKGLLPLLTALARSVRDDDDFTLSIAGRHDAHPEYAEACRQLVTNSPRLEKRITFLGAVPPEQMPALYRQSSLFVSASEMETFGMALQEARAFGVPILALDRGNAREHVEVGRTGVLTASLDDLCAALLGFARATETLRPLFDGAASAPLERRSWDDAAKTLLAAIATL